ncbi:SHOCT domain-containing protein [Virgibacillus kimchii]
MHYMHGSIWPMLSMIIFWGVLIIIGYYLVSDYKKGGRKNNSLDILKERLAKGEINEAEYERLKEIIKSKQ